MRPEPLAYGPPFVPTRPPTQYASLAFTVLVE